VLQRHVRHDVQSRIMPVPSVCDLQCRKITAKTERRRVVLEEADQA
jgi:hypothetical protein